MKKSTLIVITFMSYLLFNPSHIGAYEWKEKVPYSILNDLSSGREREVIVLIDDSTVNEVVSELKRGLSLPFETGEILGIRKSWYDSLKAEVLKALPMSEFLVIKDYSHLPMTFLRIRSFNALQSLLSHPDVKMVYEDMPRYPVLSQSLPLIGQPPVSSSGKRGGSTTVAVIDTGVDYTRPEFGSCSSPGGGCKVSVALDLAPEDGQRDDNGHGTNVAAIVVGVAPDTKIAALDVFSGSVAWDSDIIDAINWTIANKSTYNIVAMNLSLGDGLRHTSPCSTDVFATPIANARSAGIIATVASGNEGYTNGLSSPACVPQAVSVGAVYDSNVGSISYVGCTDTTTYADKVACFSNSANFLTILAPGALITAGGYTMAGTSQAAPHIAGAVAVLKGANAFPSETPDQTISRMINTGTPVMDSRNNITKPRIDLLAATGEMTYSISGRILKKSGWNYIPMTGTKVTLTGSSNAETTTDSMGRYNFTGLVNGSYTITPSMSGYVFNPSQRTVTVNGSSVANQDFIATYTGTTTYSISGRVTSGGSPLQGVTITLSGTKSGQTTTDSNGNYTFTSLTNGTYTITPSKSGYNFNPSSITVNINGSNLTGQDFVATPTGAQTYSISGRVYKQLSWGRIAPLSGVTITLTGSATGSAVTDAGGNYSFTGLSNGSYTIRPSKTGYVFTPSSRTVNINGSNIINQDFLAR